MRSPTGRRRPTAAAVDLVLLGVVAYLPFLLSDPGRLASDSKQGLYVDPRRFLVDAAFLWDPQVAAGTVPHQHIGYLWPMGPWFWAFDLVGAPDWVAQRLWLGTLTLAAALGTRWLVRSLGFGRAAALAAALVYALTPYQLAFTARTSVLLLPWAGLPWMVELTRRAVHRGGWRHPAAFALVTFTVAGVNAPTLVLVGLAPLAVLVAAAVRGRASAAAGAALRIGLLTVPACAWWLAGLRVQGAYGIDVLAVTEDLRTVASRSRPDDVLRGLGNWFFYGGDRWGPTVDQASYYDHTKAVVVASFLVPLLALAAAPVVRWRGRVIVVAMIATAVVAVGAWPYDDPSPFGRAFRWFTEQSSLGMAFRNSPRVVPVLILGLALALAAAIAATPARARRGAAAAVALVAVGGLAPVVRVGMLSDAVERPEHLPAYWEAAAAHLDASGDDTRVLELPGANFAAYRWGNAIEPITPLLSHRPYLAREVLPYGSPESALLLDALDRRLQNQVLDPASVAPVARLLGVGDVVIRSDLAYDRYGLPRPSTVWSTIVDPRAPGLGRPTTFGAPTPNVGEDPLDPLLPSDLRAGTPPRSRALAPVAVLSVADPQPIVRVASTDGALVLDGDADGIVDAAAAGIVDGRGLILESPALTDRQLRNALARSAHLVVTDSHRRRIQSWFSSIRDTRGPTERAGETIVEPTGYDARLPSFPDATDDERTVVEQLGATVTATSSGGASRPEDRPAAAFDGRPETSWRIGGANPAGNHLTIRLERATTLDHISLVQPLDGPRDRTITRVRVRVGDGPPIDVALDERSLSPAGQPITFPARAADVVDVEILATSTPPFDPALANAVGFAEVTIPGITVSETVRLPLDLLRRAGSRSRDLALDLVFTRLRSSADDWTRGDDEQEIDRTFTLPTARSFSFAATARASDRADDTVLDELFGTTSGAEVQGSSRLQGAPEARGSRAFDGDPTTAWTSAFGDDSTPSLTVNGHQIAMVQGLDLLVVADGRHSLPAEVTVRADDRVVSRRALGPVAEGTEPGHLTRVSIPLDAPVQARRLTIEFSQTTPRTSAGSDGPALPVAVAEVEGTPFPATPTTATIDPACRTDLLLVDGTPRPVRVTGIAPDGSFRLAGCGDLALTAGSHRLNGGPAAASGLDVDAATLRSAAGGPAASTPAEPARPPTPDATVTRTASHRTTVEADVTAGGEPFWFVLGQSSNAGWELRVDGATVGPRTVVDGYANGWLVSPDHDGPLHVTATWTPQRQVWWAMAVTALALLASMVILVASRPGPVPPPVPAPRFTPWDDRIRGGWTAPLVSAMVTMAVVALVSRWWIGVVAAVAAVLVARRPVVAWGVAVTGPLALAAARGTDRPELGWLALGLVLAAVIAEVVSSRVRVRR